ncbi:hypothetical protein HYC85_029080 [Camellia sinensis]|uniref:Uncharacterized protein n=1 Tax=Camellia sinensis TaxID=4442 RepID=A0A7J7FX81_CAMSI|nr:hypothetical protein HYC85_029080 [Camellia sinensis]
MLESKTLYFYWAVAHPLWEHHFQVQNIGWTLEFLIVLLERHLINAASNRNYSDASGLSLSRNEIRRMPGRGRGRGRRGRPGRQEVPVLEEIPAVQEGIGQANVAEPVG